MPLKKVAPPPDVLRAFTAGLTSLQTAGKDPGIASRAVRLLEETAPQEEHAHPVYTLGLNDLAQGKGLDAAEPAGWRVIRGDQVAGEVTYPAGGGPASMTRMSYGVPVQEISDGADKLEDLPAAQSGDYELRGLEVPGLSLQAFWLHSENDSGDLVVPVRSLTPQLANMSVYPEAEFLNIARGLAETRVQFDDEPQLQ